MQNAVNKELKVKNEMQMMLSLIAVSHPEFAIKLYEQKLLMEDLLVKESHESMIAKKK
jgi:hypothetical protein